MATPQPPPFVSPSVSRLFMHIPPRQFLRYLAVGVWNTVFAYGSFVTCTLLLERKFPRYGYIAAAAVSSVANISVAFLGYKWFIFKTKGNYFKEWIICMAVYGTSIAIGVLLLPLLVLVIRRATHIDANAPYIAAAVLVCFNALYGFLGHKNFTFKTRTVESVE